MRPGSTFLAIALLAALLISPAAARPQHSARQLLQKNAIRPDDKVPNCPSFLPVTDTSVPDMEPQAVLETRPGRSFRKFTCVGNRPTPYSEYDIRLGEITGNWWGDLKYDASGFPTYNLTWQDPYDNWKQYPRVIMTYKEFVEVPSPTGAAPWARYKVMSDTGAPKITYIERANTEDGAAPSSCGNQDSIDVPIKAEFKLYACKEAAPAPIAVVPPPPVVAASPVVQAAAPDVDAMVPTSTAVVPTVAEPVAAPAPVEEPAPVVVPITTPTEAAPAEPSTATTTGAPTSTSSTPAAVGGAAVLAVVMACML